MVAVKASSTDDSKSKQRLLEDDDPITSFSEDGSDWSFFRAVLIILAFVLLSLSVITILTIRAANQTERGMHRKLQFDKEEDDYLRDFLAEHHTERDKSDEVLHGIGQHVISKFNPPFRFEKAKTARYIVHNSDWGSVSVISVSLKAPFGVVASYCDGPVDNSTGVPYFYLAGADPLVKSMQENPESTLSLSEAQSDYCKSHDWDPEEPLCSRVSLTGKLIILPIGSDEEKFAQAALFARHPAMKGWPKDHDWKTIKLNITHVWLQDFYGPADTVAVKDYFDVKL